MNSPLFNASCILLSLLIIGTICLMEADKESAVNVPFAAETRPAAVGFEEDQSQPMPGINQRKEQ